MTTGVGNAWLDRVPVLAITGRMGSRWRGRTVQMQIDHHALYRPITKWTTELKAGAVRPTIAAAVALALAERPGPVHLDFPEDVAQGPCHEPPSDQPVVGLNEPAPAGGDPAAFDRIEQALRHARRPLVAVGLSMNRAGPMATSLLRRWLSANRLPVVSTMMAREQVDAPGVPFVGVVGRARRDIVAEYCRPADLVVGVGSDPVEFNYEDWVRPEVPIAHLDTMPIDLAPEWTVTAEWVGPLQVAIERLAAMSDVRHGWRDDELAEHRCRLERALTPPRTSFSPHHVVQVLNRVLPAHGRITVDVGAHTHLIAQLWQTHGPGSLLVSNGWSSMGFAIPAANAAALVEPGRPVVACLGDGGLLMMAGEIATAVRLRLPVTYLVFRDRVLSLIRVKQRRRGFRLHGVELHGDGFRLGETLFGAPVVAVSCAEDLEHAIRCALSAAGPSVIEAVIDPDEYDEIL
jgi:acetolactate synthase-1/2/3 large subunit